jgi:predicted TIM-barrel fold metal-dependent hydrolase
VRLIAIEEHFASAAILDATGGPTLVARMGAERAQDLTSLGERRIAAMDSAGIDVQIVSHSSMPTLMGLPPTEAVALARDANDELAAATRAYPTRLVGLALLPMSEPAAAADELERAVTKLGFVGGIVHGHTNGQFLDDDRFDVVLERFERLGVPLYLHPTPPPAAVEEIYFGGLAPHIRPVVGTNGWGWHAETGLHVLRMVCAGAFERHPALELVIGHMGEMLPFMLGRIDSTLGPQANGLQRAPSEVLLSSVYLSTSALFTVPPLACALMTFGIDRLMFAIDWPFSSNEAGTKLLDLAPVSGPDLHKLAHGNAERLFGLPGAEGRRDEQQ